MIIVLVIPYLVKSIDKWYFYRSEQQAYNIFGWGKWKKLTDRGNFHFFIDATLTHRTCVIPKFSNKSLKTHNFELSNKQ